MTTSAITTPEITTGTWKRKRLRRRPTRLRRFGEYKLNEELGVGGHARVYAAHGPDGLRAIKVLEKPEYLARFTGEFQALQQIDSPHIIRVHTFSFEPETHYVMDFVPGTTLDRHRRTMGGKLPPAEVLTIAKQICMGLNALHSRGVIHRDLCPGNCIRSPDGHITLIDLGIAQATPEFRKLHKVLGPAQSNRSLGTPGFSAPEQKVLFRCTPQADYYSLGAIIYNLLTGRHYGTERDLRKFAPRWRTFLQQLLNDSWEERFANMQELLDELDELGSDEGIQLGTNATPRAAPSAKMVLIHQVLKILFLCFGFFAALGIYSIARYATDTGTVAPAVSKTQTSSTSSLLPAQHRAARPSGQTSPPSPPPKFEQERPVEPDNLPVPSFAKHAPPTPLKTERAPAAPTQPKSRKRKRRTQSKLRRALKASLRACSVPSQKISYVVRNGKAELTGPNLTVGHKLCLRNAMPTGLRDEKGSMKFRGTSK